MNDITIRQDGCTGRVTLTRPQALNAMTYDMCMAIDAALIAWATNDDVKLVLIEAEGEKAFCAGGDIAELYERGLQKDYAFGQQFWADEYRMNARLDAYAKPVVTFLQGFTMGGGVGLGCHASHRIVGDSSRIAMPECTIGLVPDVGGTAILANAPGHLGAFLGLTGHRMTAGDAILCGFADGYLPEDQWEALKAKLVETGDIAHVVYADTPASILEQDQINRLFGGVSLRDIVNALRTETTDFATAALKALSRQNPLAMASCLEILNRLTVGTPTLAKALELEYRFTFRAMEQGDFLEGIRAQVIDKDRTPKWTHEIDKVPQSAVSAMLRPLGANTLRLDKEAQV